MNKKTDYGLELMIFLANNYGQGPVSLKTIAKEKRLPFKFLEQVVIPLREAGLIEARSGRAGGYFLKKKPKKIKITEIIEILEGPTPTEVCFGCPKAGTCGPEEVWAEMGSKAWGAIEGKNLEDLVKNK